MLAKELNQKSTPTDQPADCIASKNKFSYVLVLMSLLLPVLPDLILSTKKIHHNQIYRTWRCTYSQQSQKFVSCHWCSKGQHMTLGTKGIETFGSAVIMINIIHEKILWR